MNSRRRRYTFSGVTSEFLGSLGKPGLVAIALLVLLPSRTRGRPRKFPLVLVALAPSIGGQLPSDRRANLHGCEESGRARGNSSSSARPKRLAARGVRH